MVKRNMSARQIRRARLRELEMEIVLGQGGASGSEEDPLPDTMLQKPNKKSKNRSKPSQEELHDGGNCSSMPAPPQSCSDAHPSTDLEAGRSNKTGSEEALDSNNKKSSNSKATKKNEGRGKKGAPLKQTNGTKAEEQRK